MPASIIILICVIIGIAFRNFILPSIQIWHIMLLGAIASIFCGSITLKEAVSSINIEVIIFLVALFFIASAAEECGYLERLAAIIFSKITNIFFMIFAVTFIMGISSSILLNDTVAIAGTPIMLALFKDDRQVSKIFLMVLAFSITIGSVMTPTGNPQNLMIALESGMRTPFITMLSSLLLPTLINLLFLTGYIYLIYRKKLKKVKIKPLCIEKMSRQMKIVNYSVVIFVTLIIVTIILEVVQTKLKIPFFVIPLIATFPIILCYKNKTKTLKFYDWGTIIFFLAMFILMQSVWVSGFFQMFIKNSQLDMSSNSIIIYVSLILSQLMSNVPLVSLYLPILHTSNAGISQYMSLAVGSTIAGNILIIGAASNIIIIQAAENRKSKSFKFFEFAAVGIPLAIINIIIYLIFI